MNTLQLREKIDPLLAQYNLADKTVAKEERGLKEAKEQVATLEEAKSIVLQASQAVQEHAHRQIAAVVTRCLQTIFGDDAYEFRIRFSRKRGKTDAELLFVRDGEEIDPYSAAGGGAVDVAAFALRLSCLLLSKPPLSRLLIADEPFRFVNGEKYQERVGEMLLTLAKDLNVQMVIVTDDDWLKVGKVIELKT